MCEKERILRKRIVKIHRGSLAKILRDIDYKRIFPDAKIIFEANRMTREIYPEDKEFMAFEVVQIHMLAQQRSICMHLEGVQNLPRLF